MEGLSRTMEAESTVFVPFTHLHLGEEWWLSPG